MLVRVCILITALAAPAAADSLRAHATRLEGSITIDGHLDEPCWQKAPKQGGFTQRFPIDGGKPSFDTQFAILYDNDAVYVGVWAHDPEPSKIKALLVRRDADSSADAIAIGFDSYHDKRTAYVFQLDAAGVQRDMLLFDDQSQDDTWDAVWTGDAAITPDGWTAEYRIPLNQLRFPNGDKQEWGFQVTRVIGRTSEQEAWNPWPRSSPQIVSKFGVVDGIDNVPEARRLELLPYALGGVDVAPVDRGDPLNSHVTSLRNLGLDLRYGLGPAFTLSATINPDFGQVEADPSQINLSGNELFFAEKRPFFLEGVDLFKLPIGANGGSVDTAFYSRRIGAKPPDPDADYEYIKSPAATTIYGAMKLTGKTRGGWSVGVLDAVTGSENATIVDANGMRSEPLVAPLTNYAVGRVKRDFREGATSFGASVTAVDRDVAGTPMDAIYRDQAYTGGVQVQHRWDDNAWMLDFRGTGSYVHGSEAAIAATQQSMVHLYQRPDASDVHFDPHRTSLTGMDLTLKAGRLGDTKHWRTGIGANIRTPGLELNDVGFLISADRQLGYYLVEYHQDSPGDTFLNYDINTDVFAVGTAEPRMETYGYELNTHWQLLNYWQFNAGANLANNVWDYQYLRGGPTLHQDPNVQGYFEVDSDTRKRVWASIAGRANTIWAQDEWEGGIDAGVTVQAAPNIDVFAGPSWYERDDPQQFVQEADDMAGVPHYVLARIKQTTASMTVRLNWTFSPHLSLQAYAQPFIASGRYSEYKDFYNPHASTFTDRFHELQGNEYQIDGGTVHASYNGTYSFDKPDFDLRQLRSTVVLRWEYRPGSYVFAVWSHAATSSIDDGRFRLGTDLSGLVHAPAENVVMVKANYWIGL
ncbi:MAG TPA: DUF5916 domain-containing protein [Kofleriaceae bacterium]|nr:DUF5916 domain-containing protein [Kofleriaceae bacterium]